MNATETKQGAACSFILAPWVYNNEIGITILRVGVAIMMLCHGWPKLVLLFSGQGSEWMDPLGLGSTLSLGLCTFAEFFCSLAILLGLFARLAAFVLVVNFWVIVFVYGADSSWTQSELPMLYLICFLTLLCTGAGPLSIDRWLSRRLDCRYREDQQVTSRQSAAKTDQISASTAPASSTSQNTAHP